MGLSRIEITPTMDPATMANAVNDNFRQIEAESRTKIITDEEGVDRVLLGKEADGDYSIKVSLPGVNVQDAADNELVMSSDFNMYKIFKSGYIEPVTRTGLVTLTGNNVGYLFDIYVVMDNTAGTEETFSGQIMANVCWDNTKDNIISSGLYMDDGTNQAFYEIKYELSVNTNILRISCGIKLTKGTVTVDPTEYYRRMYWQLANPTRDAPAGMGATSVGDGKFYFFDRNVFAEDGTMLLPLKSATVQFINGNWKTFPRVLPAMDLLDVPL